LFCERSSAESRSSASGAFGDDFSGSASNRRSSLVAALTSPRAARHFARSKTIVACDGSCGYFWIALSYASRACVYSFFFSSAFATTAPTRW
jgi:hypothetical protein